jgi:hypothetical protein
MASAECAWQRTAAVRGTLSTALVGTAIAKGCQAVRGGGARDAHG